MSNYDANAVVSRLLASINGQPVAVAPSTPAAAVAAATTAAVANVANGAVTVTVTLTQPTTVTVMAGATGTNGVAQAAASTVNGLIVGKGSVRSVFTKPYIFAHALTFQSLRYSWFMYIAIGTVLVVWSLAYQLSGPGAGVLGATFRKYGIRKLMFGGKQKMKKDGTPGRKTKQWATPTIAQLIATTSLIAFCVLLSVVGDDWISADRCIWGSGICRYNQTTTFSEPNRIYFELSGKPVKDPNGYIPSLDPRLSFPTENVFKSWWSWSDRVGMIAYTMFPLVITLGVKQWPFNIWATPFLTNYHFDKTVLLHRWSGRVIWLFATAHTIAWLVQAFKERDPMGNVLFVDVWLWFRFVGGVTAYVFLTLLLILSSTKMCTKHYELFYALHCFFTVVLFAACIVHTGMLMAYPIIALAIWWGERGLRLYLMARINKWGFLFGRSLRRRQAAFDPLHAEKGESWRDSTASDAKTHDEEMSKMDYAAALPKISTPRTRPTKRPSYYEYGPGQDHAYLRQNNFPRPQINNSADRYDAPQGSDMHPPQYPPTVAVQPAPHIGRLSRGARKGQPGFAVAQLLPGKTVRLTINVPSTVRWRPGQHVCITIPVVAALQGHYYTISNVDERADGIVEPGGRELMKGEGTEIVLIIRAQKGFSKSLYDYVVHQRRMNAGLGLSQVALSVGVSMRTLVSMPMGTAGRNTWDSFESLLVLVGGTGITFGVAVLEYTARRMAEEQRLSTGNKRFKTQRLRFLWIVTEYSHISWVAPTLRRCLEILPPGQLQIDVYVSRDPAEAQRRLAARRAAKAAVDSRRSDESARPLAPQLADIREDREEERDDDVVSEDGDNDRQLENEEEHGVTLDDMIVWEGEEQVPSQAESNLSAKVRKEGKLRRAQSRLTQGYRRPTLMRQATVQREGQPQQGMTLSIPENNVPMTMMASPMDMYAGGDTTFGQFPSPTLEPITEQSGLRELLEDPAKPTGFSVIEDGSELMLDLSPEDQDDLEVISELARGGRPPIVEIMDAEIANSSGKTMIACCGPHALNTMIRNHVSERIDLQKVFKGDLKGHVSLAAEDFSF